VVVVVVGAIFGVFLKIFRHYAAAKNFKNSKNSKDYYPTPSPTPIRYITFFKNVKIPTVVLISKMSYFLKTHPILCMTLSKKCQNT